jgi:uncharacterized membrane protein
VAEEGTIRDVVDRNIDALIRRRRAQEQEQSREERLAGAVTSFTGSMRFVYIHLAVFGTWILWNLGWPGGWLGLPRFDRSFVVLAMVASVEAIFLSTFVLISQNRAAAQADERADLDLQICLLTEHEVTRLMELTAAIGRSLGIALADDPHVADLQHDVRPEQVIDAMEARRSAGDAPDQHPSSASS